MNGCFRALVPKVMLFSISGDYLEVDIKWSMVKFAADPRWRMHEDEDRALTDAACCLGKVLGL